ncbi:MAG: DUF3098 domain-containing protein [Porphyromonas sp.]|nr:DUF3098 domain-containing protein [Porphyromonas sp.]
MIFTRKNYLLVGVSITLIIVGFVLMGGGGSKDGVSFNPAIFSLRRIVVAPAVSLIGFLLMIYAILSKPRNSKSETSEKA